MVCVGLLQLNKRSFSFYVYEYRIFFQISKPITVHKNKSVCETFLSFNSKFWEGVLMISWYPKLSY